MKRTLLFSIGLLLLGLMTTVCGSQSPLGTIPVKIGESKVYAEVADNMIERQRGLMWRKEMADERGMLFVFDEDEVRSFWMKNTLLPLSIAYLNKDRKILNILKMAPNNSTLHYRSAGPARYALEVNQGWFEKRGIGAGDVVEFDLKDLKDLKE